jgi:hypothetical protein
MSTTRNEPKSHAIIFGRGYAMVIPFRYGRSDFMVIPFI